MRGIESVAFCNIFVSFVASRKSMSIGGRFATAFRRYGSGLRQNGSSALVERSWCDYNISLRSRSEGDLRGSASWL